MTAFDFFVCSEEFVKLGRRAPANDAEGNIVPPAPVQEETARTYTAMFGKFVRWMEKHGRHLFDITGHDILAFLELNTGKGRGKPRDLNSDIQRRYLRLLERIYAHLDVRPNPARSAEYMLKNVASTARDQPKASLSDEEQAAFMAALPACAGSSPVAIAPCSRWCWARG